MDSWFKDSIPLLALMVSLGNSYFVSRLSMQAKYRDRDLNKEYELNTVLSNLLDVWYCLKQYEIAQKRIIYFEQQLDVENVFPKEMNTFIAYTTFTAVLKQINDSCFDELDQSIKNLKKYDPITYFRHIDTGTHAKQMCSVSTFITHTQQSSLQATNELVIKEALNDVKISIDEVATLIKPKMVNQINSMLEDIYTDNELIERFDQSVAEFKKKFLPSIKLIFSQMPPAQLAIMATPAGIEEMLSIFSKSSEELGIIAKQALPEIVQLSEAIKANFNKG